MRGQVVLLLLLLAWPGTRLGAQENEALARARAAYDALDYAGAIAGARAAVRSPLRAEDRVNAYELLGFAYGALDSTRAAVDAFRQLIFLAPDREPDVERVSPRITSLYASALGQVLVVRHLALDSATFVAGVGSANLYFEVSRQALTSTRLVGSGVDFVVDTQSVPAGRVRVRWRATRANGAPLAPGEYEVIVTARESERSEYASAPLRVQVAHGRVDTLPLLDSLPGYQRQPEMVSPPRDWRPLALTVLYTGIVAAAVLAVDQKRLGTAPRAALAVASGGAIATGLVLSLRPPDPRPSSTNILYNQLLGELLARRNAEIGRENAARRAQVLLTVQVMRP